MNTRLLCEKLLLLIVSSIKLVAEIALLALLGQWLLGVLAGKGREQNIFYRLLQVVTSPFVRMVRRITPRAVLDRHMPLAAFVLLAMVWVLATIAKINICVQIGVQACR
jgi:ABC-type multidrug transport system permease subunit